jgi:hypothetical protein
MSKLLKSGLVARLRQLGHLKARADRARRIAAGSKCPECESSNTEDQNPAVYRCRDCDHHWGVKDGARYGY